MAGRVEAEHQLAGTVVVVSKRVFELVAVAPLLNRRHDRLHREAVELADPPQRVLDLLGLISTWRSYGSTCHGTPGCGACAGIRSGDGSSISTVIASA